MFARHNADMNIPPPPLQRGEERSEGGMLSLQRGKSEVKEDVTPSKGKCRGLTAVRALKGRVNSAQCAAKQSVGKQGNPPAEG